LLLALAACRGDPPAPRARIAPTAASFVSATATQPLESHPVVAPAPPEASLPPLRATWLEWLGEGDTTVVVTPPLGVVSPTRLVVGVHGAGDRPDWSCGGWRLASQVSVFITCPQGSKQTSSTFAWKSGAAIEAGVDHAIEAARARFGAYIDGASFVYAGFSQGATLAEPLLRKQAARFPIAVLAEGGYQTAQSPAFAAAYHGAGGRRVVLVCGTPNCFRSAASSKTVLQRAGLEVLVAGDAKAGHNLNQEMQRALQAVWPQIIAPLR
jgi:predicted esterase